MEEFIEVPSKRQKTKLIYGIGINDAKYITNKTVNGVRLCCPYYVTWSNMLKRCYCVKLHKKQNTYSNCTVCSDWLIFSNFKAWMQEQDYVGKELDKDLLIRGNLEYSPNTCIFVSSHINTLLGTCGTRKGKYPLGVCWNKARNKFIAQCSDNGKHYGLGYFITEKEASNAYLTFKRELILVIANQQDDLRLKNALNYIANTEYCV